MSDTSPGAGTPPQPRARAGGGRPPSLELGRAEGNSERHELSDLPPQETRILASAESTAEPGKDVDLTGHTSSGTGDFPDSTALLRPSSRQPSRDETSEPSRGDVSRTDGASARVVGPYFRA